ncbi:MAG: hypothetical protein OHK0012_13740 [Synechococcales cyanobacterium]
MAGLSVAMVIGANVSDDLPLPDWQRAVGESPLLMVSDDPATADLRVEAFPDGIFRFYRPDEASALAAVKIPVKRAQALPRRLLGLLEHIAAYTNLLQIQPPSPFLGDSVRVEFFQLVTPATRTTLPQVAPLSPNSAGELALTSGQSLVIQVSHTALSPLYVYVVALDTRRLGSTLVYPYSPDQLTKVVPNEILIIGGGPVYTVDLELPAAELSSLDLFKIFISSSPIDAKVMALPPLGQRQEPSSDPYGAGSRLDRELRLAILGQSGLTPIPDFYRDPWWCCQQPIRITANR